MTGKPGPVYEPPMRLVGLNRPSMTALTSELRVAGALVLLYGQIPSRIVELTIDSVTTTGTDP